MNRQKIWQKIWSRKYDSHSSIADLHVAAGYDMLTSKQWQKLTHFFISKLGLKSTDKVLEVGCGCGAFLNQLNGIVESMSGIDYSESAINHLDRILTGSFKVAEANQIPFSNDSFDVVLSFGVFFYFQDLNTALLK